MSRGWRVAEQFPGFGAQALLAQGSMSLCFVHQTVLTRPDSVSLNASELQPVNWNSKLHVHYIPVFSLRKIILKKKKILLILNLGALALFHPLLRTTAESYLKLINSVKYRCAACVALWKLSLSLKHEACGEAFLFAWDLSVIIFQSVCGERILIPPHRGLLFTAGSILKSFH